MANDLLTLSDLSPALLDADDNILVRPNTGTGRLIVFPCRWADQAGAALFVGGSAVALSHQDALQVIEALTQAIQE